MHRSFVIYPKILYQLSALPESNSMSIRKKIKEELWSLLEATLYFGFWIFSLLLVKVLILEEYQITFAGWSTALIGVLVLAKVVLILEHVPLGSWVRRQPAWLDVLLRTSLYVAGVFVVMIAEKAFEGRHEHGGFVNALAGVLKHADMPHLWANTICMTGALFGYNHLAVIRSHFGAGGLVKLFLVPVAGETHTSDANDM